MMVDDDVHWDAKYFWKIKNFTSCSHRIGDCLTSADFTVNGLSGVKWRSLVYPGGVFEDNQHISCFVKMLCENETAKYCIVDSEVSFLNVRGEILQRMTLHNKIFSEEHESWGWGSYAKIDRVKAELKKCANDTLIVRCLIKNKDARNKTKHEKYAVEWPIKVLPKGIFSSSKHFFCLESILFEINVSLDKGNFSIDICKVTKSAIEDHKIQGKISVLNAKGKEVLTKTEVHTFSSKDEREVWKFPQLFTKRKSNGTINIYEYTFDGNIILSCQFCAQWENIIEATVPNPYSETVSNIWGLGSLTSDLKNFLFNKSNSDVKLQANGEEKLFAHKFILSARSSVFSAMFKQGTLEFETGTVNIKDVDSKTLQSFLEFLYTGTVGMMNYEKATKLLSVAEKYQVSSLKEMCAIFLKSALSIKKVCEILLFADLFNLEHLKIMSFDFISVHADSIFPSMEWLELVERNAKLSTEVNAYIVKNCKIIPKCS